jgi:hypothetical protein
LIKDVNILNKLESNIDFWLEQERYLPNLKELFFVLYNIPPASAAIERHFNVCSRLSLNATPR